MVLVGGTFAGEVVIDDRLATVLATPANGEGAGRIQYRQLLDLLGRMSPDFVLPAPALARLTELGWTLPASDRAAILRSAPASLRHPGLILRLAAHEPSVAAAAIAAARIDDWQWSALIAELPLAARGHVRHRRDLGPRAAAMLARFGIGGLGLPSPDRGASANAGDVLDLADFTSSKDHSEALTDGFIEVPAAQDDGPHPHEGIGAIVRRIEAFRRNRQAGTRQFGEEAGDSSADPRLPLRDPVHDEHAAPARAMRFASDARGRFAWADDGFAAAMVGLPLGTNHALAAARCDKASMRAIRQRRPVRQGRIEIDGAPLVAGVWRIDAAPQFDPAGGRFTGYRGVLRRPTQIDARADDPADRLRQLLHELRTPINAIQGFAELIQQQLFGPTPHQYRSLAASIAADSASILAGFEEIELLVQLETGRGEQAEQSEVATATTDLAALVERLIGQIAPALAPRDVRFEFESGGEAPVALTKGKAERLVWRLLASLAASASPGEWIMVELAASGGSVELGVALPAALAGNEAAALFKVLPADVGSPLALGLLGGGFALRLARAEARAAGGSLDLDHGRLRLCLPGRIPAQRNTGEFAGEPGLTPRVDGNSPLPTATAFSARSAR